MRRGLGIVLTVLLLAPAAEAGDESDPEVDDARDLRDPSLDLLSAWFSADPKGVRFTIKLAGLEDDLADHLYFMSFTLHGARYLAVVGYDDQGDVHGHVGDPPRGARSQGGIETLEDNLLSPEIREGTPGYVTAVIPWNGIDGLEPNVVLLDIAAGTSMYDRARDTLEGSVDTRGTDRTYTTQRVLLPPGAGPWVAVGAAAVVLAGAGGAVAYLVARKRRSPSVPAPIAVSVQGPAPPRPPPQEPVKPKFSLRPPQ